MNSRSVGIGFLGLLLGAGIALLASGSHEAAAGAWGPWMMSGSWGMMGFFWVFPLMGIAVMALVVTLLVRATSRSSMPQTSRSPSVTTVPTALPTASDATTCGRCGKRVEDEWLTCPYCSKPLEERAIVSSAIR